MTKGEIAESLFKEGYNCSQAVVGAFADEMGIERKKLMRLSSSFGGGMGRMREVCGAVSGMFMVIGALKGYSDPKAFDEKKAHYANIRDCAEKFKAENGSIICRELLGLSQGTSGGEPEKRTQEYYKKRPCGELVHLAADIADDFIKKNKTQE